MPGSKLPLIPVLGATTAGQMITTLSALSLAAIAPAVAESLNVAPELVGYQVSLIYGAATLMSLFGGILVVRNGAARALQVSLLCSLCGMVAIAFGVWMGLLVGSILIGVGYGIVNPSAAHLLGKATPVHLRNLIFSLKQTGVPLGGVLAGLVLPVVTEAYGWQAAPFVPIGLAVLLILAIALARNRWDSDRRPNTPYGTAAWSTLKLVAQDKALLWLGIASFMLSVCQLVLATFMTILLVKDLGYSLIAAGSILAASQASGAAGRVLWGAIADRLGDGLLLLVGVSVAMAALYLSIPLLSAETGQIGVFALFMALGATAVGWNGVFVAAIIQMAPHGRTSEATGGVMVLTFGGVLAGPSLYAQLVPLAGGQSQAFPWVALVALFAGFSLWRSKTAFQKRA